jgi:hypothetical protein
MISCQADRELKLIINNSLKKIGRVVAIKTGGNL